MQSNWTTARQSSTSSTLNNSDPCYGIRQIYPSSDQAVPEGKRIVLDVVCVHGLNGHPQRSFTHLKTNVYWPRDLLPDQVPTARVLTYGYDASSKYTAIGESVLDIALQLINTLKDVRRQDDERDRDILFVCHSLGGIIVKKAILLHHSCENAKAVQRSIIGVFFMGTPHCGSSFANIGSVVARIASTFVDAPRNLLRMLKKDSSALYDISREFAIVASELGLHLTSFYELNPFLSPFWMVPRKIIVEKRSAILGLPHEEILAVHAHHGELCKFESAEDPNFRPVWIRIEDFSAHAREKLQALELDSEDTLGSLEYQTRRVVISPPPRSRSVTPTLSIANLNCLWKVPFLPCASFIGRQSLIQQMHDYFSDIFDQRQRRFAIYGLGGSGKTQLALNYAFKNRLRYAGVFFVDANTEISLQDDYERIHVSLHLSDPKDKIGAVQIHFQKEYSVKWLLIFDNADDLEAYNLSGYFPISENVHIIITSRDHSSSELAPEGVLLEMMEPEESKTLLLSRAGLFNPTEQTQQDVENIVEQLSHLPLAIDQAGAYMHTRKCSPAAYLRRFETERDRVLKFSPKLSSYKKSVITAWEVSFMRLETAAPLASKLLLLFSYLDSRRISEDLLLGLTKPVTKMDLDGNPHSVNAVDHGIDPEVVEDADEYEEAIQKLLSFSFIRDHVEQVGARDVRVFSLHPLVAYCTQSRVVQAVKRHSAEQAINVLSHAFPEWSINFCVVEFGRLIRSHLIRCLGYIDQSETFGSNLEEHARKLLLIIWSVRTVQLYNMKPRKTESEVQMLSKAFKMAMKYGDAYISLAAVSVHYRHYDSIEFAERLCGKYIRDNGLESGRDPTNLDHRGRFNSVLGDLVIFRSTLRRDLNMGDDPAMLLHAWSPIDPESPSILERNAKWWRDRTVGSQYTAIGKYQEAERILIDHVAEFPRINFTGTDEHLAGACYLADLYYVQEDWKRAENALREPMRRACEIERDFTAWHTLQAEIRLQEILVCGDKFEEAKERALKSNQQLQEMALPEFTIAPMFATWCLLAQIAHEQNQWGDAERNWKRALDLGQSMDWPVGRDMNLARCSLEALDYRTAKLPLNEKSFQNWSNAIHIGRSGAEGGVGNHFLYGFGDAWRKRLGDRLRQDCL